MGAIHNVMPASAYIVIVARAVQSSIFQIRNFDMMVVLVVNKKSRTYGTSDQSIYLSALLN